MIEGLHEMDEMGAWGDSGEVWLPRSQYTKGQARTFMVRECGHDWIDVRVLARWMRHAPENAPEEFGGEYWIECDKHTPGAFQVWRCE